MKKIWKAILHRFILFIFLIFFSIVSSLAVRIIFDNAAMATRIYQGLIIGIFLGVPYAVILFILLIPSKDKYHVAIGLCIWVVLAVFFFMPPSPARLFKRVVKSPIPESVRDIRASLSFAASDHLYIMNFKISKEDIEDILASKGFQGVRYLSYEHGVVKYEGGTFLANGYKQPPTWFKLESWSAPQVYVVEIERENEQLLIYNSDLMEAYLIDFKW